MGTVYRKTVTKALPAGAELFIRKGQRFARWKDAKGKTRTAKLTTASDGADRIVIQAGTFTAKYRNGAGLVVETATGCHDETAARRTLGELERRGELVKSGVMTTAEDAISDHQPTALVEHFDAYRAFHTAKGLNAVRIKNTRARLVRLATDCGFRRLADLTADALEKWLGARAAESPSMSPGNRNEFRQELVGFGNWCVRTRRLVSNPFATVPKADAKADQRRKRRSMTEAELERLLDVARWRPVAEYGRETRPTDPLTRQRKRETWEYLPLTLETLDAALTTARRRLAKRPDFIARLERLGRERALIYKTLVLTGLRLNELRTLTVGQLQLDGPVPFLTLDAADEKNRQGNDVALRQDLADDLTRWIDRDRERLNGAAMLANDCQPSATLKLPARPDAPPSDAPLFKVPAALVRILDRDLLAAGIAKRDERGRTLDVHALRHTFGTLLSKGGVMPRTAQAAMRHSTIDLTMNVYTDPKLLDVHGALDSLPALSLDGERRSIPQTAKATGTDDLPASPFAPAFAPTTVKPCKSGSIADKSPSPGKSQTAARPRGATSMPVKANNPLTIAVSGLHQVERTRVELATSALRTQRSPN